MLPSSPSASSTSSVVTVIPVTPAPATTTFTLNDLAKIALGAPKLTQNHLSVLQSLLIILLRKLDCHNETVKIKGMPAKCLQKLLEETPTHNKYDFQMKSLKSFKEKYELLGKVERRLNDVETKLEKHFNQIRRCHMTTIFKVELWDYYASSVEDLCSLYMPQNKDLCLLVRNVIFNRELRERITYPLVEHIKEFEVQIEQLRQKLQDLHKRADENSPSEKCLQHLISKIEHFRPGIRKDNEVFREAMEETQDMLNCKLERVTLPALKKYLDDRFDVIKEHLTILRIEANRCSRSKPLIIKKQTCLSCARHNDLKRTNQLQPIESVKENVKCACSTHYVGEYTILEKLDRMSPPVHRSYLLITSPIIGRPSRHNSIFRSEMRGILVNNEMPPEEDSTKDEKLNVCRPSIRKSLRSNARPSRKSLISNTVSIGSVRKVKSVHLDRYHYGT